MYFTSKILSTLYLLFLFYSTQFAQTPYQSFFDALINKNNVISSFVDTDELARSLRLGIIYNGVSNKFLISYDIDDNIKREITEKKIEYRTSVLETDEEYSKIEFKVPALNYTKYFYFKSGKFIAPSTYYSRHWEIDSSKYFVFKISEPKYFNNYCKKKLDEFVDKIADMLEYTNDERQLLEKQKIYYILCKDENEIKTVSGFGMRGQYLTAFDEILTTYSTHYHELAHLLMNYKLKNLSLFTLPFFMEGFAVATGGRGGMSSRVVTDLGLYLQLKGLLTYDSIITNDAFYNEDASLTYPVAGLYNLFLMNTIGMKSYLDLYKKANGDMNYLKSIKMGNLSLPDNTLYEQFLAKYQNEKTISLSEEKDSLLEVNIGSEGVVISTYLNYDFGIKSNFMELYLRKRYFDKNYKSVMYEEIAQKKYRGEIYLIKVDETYIKIYNCYNNELIASYDTNFSLDNKTIPISVRTVVDGEQLVEKYFDFRVVKSVFDLEFQINR